MPNSVEKPGILSLVEIGGKEKRALVTYLSKLRKTDSFFFLERILGEDFLMFLDVFSGDVLRVPKRQDVYDVITYLRVYFYLESRGITEQTLESATKVFGRRKNSIRRIYAKVKKVLESED